MINIHISGDNTVNNTVTAGLVKHCLELMGASATISGTTFDPNARVQSVLTSTTPLDVVVAISVA